MALGEKVTAAQLYDRMVPALSGVQNGATILAKARKMIGRAPGHSAQ